MSVQLPVIDGDGHLLEDIEAIAARMPAGFAPPNRSTLQDVYPPKDHLHSAQPLKMLEGSMAQVGPTGWVEFAEKVGIERAALYPTWGLQSGLVTNPDWAIALCRAYNDWLHETYVQPYDRFVGVGPIPLQEPAAAVEEIERAVTELGMRAVMLPATGLASPLGASVYWPVYEAADRLGCAISVHGGVHTRMGLDHMEHYLAVNALGHPFGQMIAFTSFLINGVFDRYPNIRFGFLEGGISWLMVMLERLERAWDTHIPLDPRKLSLQLDEGETVSDHIRTLVADKRIFVGCEGEEPFIPELVKALGANPVFFSSDYPHETNPDRCIEDIEELAENPDLAEADRRAILADNARILYGLA